MNQPSAEYMHEYRKARSANPETYGESRKGKPLKPIPEHGTLERYRSRVAPCREECCKKAYNEYMRLVRNGQTKPRKVGKTAQGSTRLTNFKGAQASPHTRSQKNQG